MTESVAMVAASGWRTPTADDEGSAGGESEARTNQECRIGARWKNMHCFA